LSVREDSGGWKRQGDNGATGVDVEVSGDRELKVTERGVKRCLEGAVLHA
jgi:hypothetical protein